jgi:outer membrane biosynthesis protein TonB
VAEKAGDGAAGARQELPEGSNKKKNSGHVCGRSGCGESKPEMMICGKCQLTHYCDKQCQRADWKVHKTGCNQESIARRAREERALSLLATEHREEAEEAKVEEKVQEETEEDEKEEEKEEAKAEAKAGAKEETKEEGEKEETKEEHQVEPEEGMEAVEIVADAARAAVEEEYVEHENAQKQQEDAEAACTSGSFPNEFLCPIILELMRDPVVAKDGHTYERKAIEDWFRQSSISPKTLDVIGRQLTPNHTVRALIGDEESRRRMIEAELLRSLDLQHLQSFTRVASHPRVWSSAVAGAGAGASLGVCTKDLGISPSSAVGVASVAAPAALAPAAAPAAPAVLPSFLQQPPTTWSAELVADWLGNIGEAYAEYGDAFIKNGIDGEELLGDDFGKELEELGVASKMHQRRVIKEIQKLKR